LFIFYDAHELPLVGSVRQYRILQSGFVTPFGRELHFATVRCSPHSEPTCHLLTLPGVTPVCKGLAPFGKKHTCCYPDYKKNLYFSDLIRAYTQCWRSCKNGNE